MFASYRMRFNSWLTECHLCLMLDGAPPCYYILGFHYFCNVISKQYLFNVQPPVGYIERIDISYYYCHFLAGLCFIYTMRLQTLEVDNQVDFLLLLRLFILVCQILSCWTKTITSFHQYLRYCSRIGTFVLILHTKLHHKSDSPLFVWFWTKLAHLRICSMNKKIMCSMLK